MQYLKIRIKLLLLSLYFTFKADTAYVFNNWGNIISGTAFIISALIFNDALYSNTNSIAGLNRDQMLFFMGMSQLCFYTFAALIWQNIRILVQDVNSGQLDLILTKPIPSLFYCSFKIIDIFSVLRDYLPGMFILILSINFNNINFEVINLIAGLIILFLGVLISGIIHFISALPVFWLGESSNLIDLSFFVEYDLVHPIPFEGWGFSREVKYLFLFIIPFLISAGLSTFVVFGKINTLLALNFTFIVFILFSLLKTFLWKLALRAYTSASS